MRAYILMILKSPEEIGIVDELRKIDGVKYADVVYGGYDVVTVIEAPGVSDIGRVIDKLRKRPGIIEKTSTLIVKE